MRISFLLHDLFEVGSTNRAVITLAGELAREHDVELVSTFRRRDHPVLPVPVHVRVHTLVDLRPRMPDRTDPGQRKRSAIVPGEEEHYSAYSRLTDERLQAYLAGSGRDVYVGTRSALNLAVARWGPAGAVLLGQERPAHATVAPGLREAMRASYGRLSAVTTLTETDARAFRELTPIPGLRVVSAPDPSPLPPLEPSDTSGNTMLAVGRLGPIQRYDVLLHALRSVVDLHPDWSLRIYGGGAGAEAEALRELITALALTDNVLLMGRHARLESELVKGAMVVSTSERRTIGMSVVEAMRAGLPVVSTRAPVGLEEVVADGVDGFLVPLRDASAISRAICTLIEDPERRRLMGRRARESAARFDPQVVVQVYESLFRQLAQEGTGQPGSGAEESSLVRTRNASDARQGAGRIYRFGRRSTCIVVGFAGEVARALLSGRPSGRLAAHTARAAARALRSEVRELRGRVPTAPVVHVTLEPTSALRFEGAPGRATWRRLLLTSRDGHQDMAVELTPVPADQAGTVRPWAAADEVVVRGRLDGATVLGEGRWGVHVELSNGRRIRARAGVCDTRHAAAPSTEVSGEVFSRRLPYRMDDDHLAIRSWVRRDHAEVESVTSAGGALRLRGRLSSADGGLGGDRLHLVAVGRRAGSAAWVSEPAACPRDGQFVVSVDIDRLAGQRVTRHDDWDLYLEDAGTGRRARLARLTDDIVDRKPVYVYGFTRCEVSLDPLLHEEHPVPVVEARPYVTSNSDVSLVIRER